MSNYTYIRSLKNREGATLITAIMVIALIAMLAMTAAYSALVEKRIADNMVKNTSVFYAAESGLAHAETVLLQKYTAASAPNWSFALDGSLPADFTYPATPAFHCEGCEAAGVTEFVGAWLAGGVDVLPTKADNTYNLDGLTYTYTVTAWNNNDGPACGGATADTLATADCDGRLILRSVAQVVKEGTIAPILGETVLEETITATVVAGVPPTNTGFTGPGSGGTGPGSQQGGAGNEADTTINTTI